MEGSFERESSNSLSYGLNIHYRISERFSLIAGYAHERKGGLFSYHQYNFETDYFQAYYARRKIVNTYHAFPVYLQYSKSIDRVKFFADAGFSISRLMDSRMEGVELELEATWDGGYERTQAGEFHAGNNGHTNKTDVGVVVGAGVSLRVHERLSIAIYPQFTIGLRKIDAINSNVRIILPNTNGDYELVEDYYGLSSYSKNIAVSLNVGAKFQL